MALTVLAPFASEAVCTGFRAIGSPGCVTSAGRDVCVERLDRENEVGYKAILFIASGDDGADGAALSKLCRSFIDARAKLYLLYIGEHHVTGFGAMTARHHIANDMQIKQEMFPRLKRIGEDLSIPADRICIRFGDRALTIERFVQEKNVDMLAIGSEWVAENSSVIKLFTKLLVHCECDLHVMQ